MPKELNLSRRPVPNHPCAGGRQNIPIHTDITYQPERLIDDRPPGLSLQNQIQSNHKDQNQKGKKVQALDPYNYCTGCSCRMPQAHNGLLHISKGNACLPSYLLVTGCAAHLRPAPASPSPSHCRWRRSCSIYSPPWVPTTSSWTSWTADCCTHQVSAGAAAHAAAYDVAVRLEVKVVHSEAWGGSTASYHARGHREGA